MWLKEHYLSEWSQDVVNTNTAFWKTMCLLISSRHLGLTHLPLVSKFKDSVIKHLQTQRGGVRSSAELLHDPRLIHLIMKLWISHHSSFSCSFSSLSLHPSFCRLTRRTESKNLSSLQISILKNGVIHGPELVPVSSTQTDQSIQIYHPLPK